MALEGENTLGDGASSSTTRCPSATPRSRPRPSGLGVRSGTNITSTLDIAPEYWTVAERELLQCGQLSFRRVRFRKDSETEDNGTAEINFKRERGFSAGRASGRWARKYRHREKAWDRTNRDTAPVAARMPF